MDKLEKAIGAYTDAILGKHVNPLPNDAVNARDKIADGLIDAWTKMKQSITGGPGRPISSHSQDYDVPLQPIPRHRGTSSKKQ